jgi:hypothetical protein
LQRQQPARSRLRRRHLRQRGWYGPRAARSRATSRRR